VLAIPNLGLTSSMMLGSLLSAMEDMSMNLPIKMGNEQNNVNELRAAILALLDAKVGKVVN
jgi:hypothetical protein